MPRNVATTKLGSFEGKDLGSCVSFKGIPFAKPPVGSSRFRPPEPYPGHRGVQDATSYGPSCLQPPSELLPQAGPTEQSEDCLYLNVWTPAADSGGRPVMVWIHGGAFVMGSGAFPFYNGAKLASEGVVVVTINYRLGPFGFLYVPALMGERYSDASNLGLHDQVVALRWIREHIADFGGDPDRITIFGESAGGMSVGCLLASPESSGLFRRAIAQSGAAHNALSTDAAATIAERFAEELLDLAGAPPSELGTLLATADARLLLEASIRVQQRGVSASAASEERSASRSRTESEEPPRTDPAAGEAAGLLPFQPVVDGRLLPKLPIVSVADGAAPEISLIAGSNRDEYLLFAPMDPGFHKLDKARVVRRIERFLASVSELRSRMASKVEPSSDGRASHTTADSRTEGRYSLRPDWQRGSATGHGPATPSPKRQGSHHQRQPDAAEIYDAYEEIVSKEGAWQPEPRYVWSAIATDFMFGIPALRLAQAQARHGDARLYLFNWESPIGGRSLGSCHALEIPFVFGTTKNQAARLFCGEGEAVERLSAVMRGCWRTFAETGTPRDENLGDWPRLEPTQTAEVRHAVFGESCHIAPYDERRARLWDGIL